MEVPYSIEELIIDDSFIHYCKGNDEAAIARWENYLLFFPGEKEKVEEAKNFVTGTILMLTQKEQWDALQELKTAAAALQQREAEATAMIPPAGKRASFKKYIPYAAAAIFVGAILFFLTPGDPSRHTIAETATVAKTNSYTALYQTAYGEKKEVWLPDSSRVILNAGSTLRVDSSFGQNSRKIYLSGEALFDVTHNKALPFSVHVTNFEVKVLGTLFNVKAYPNDKIQEASLIRGKVELLMKNRQGQRVILTPNQKVVVNNQEAALNGAAASAMPDILPVTFNTKDSSVIETSWAYNRLDIYNKEFIDIQADLERFYNVKISFADNAVRHYRFSATFENETIEQVLQALQLSYPFHYKIQNNQITISR